MADADTDTVPRTPEEPTPEQVRSEMNTCEPYTVSDLQDTFKDASRWTIQRRLDTLVEDGQVAKKKHSETRASYWIARESDTITDEDNEAD
jgi:uncharacterized protein VirK/YbjX